MEVQKSYDYWCLSKGGNNPEKIWDYTGVVFPEGFIAPDKMFMFNNEQIEQIFAMGYQDS